MNDGWSRNPNKGGILMKFAILETKMTFNNWINVEYGIVKRQYKELNQIDKRRLKKEYKEYQREE